MKTVMSNLSKVLWVDKYRPSEINEVILPDRISSVFADGVVKNNVLFSGDAGCGKTTLALILIKNHNTLKIDGSVENSIDTVRTKIIDFVGSASLTSNGVKVVFIDEMDRFSPEAQDGLRGTIEKYSRNARFIATCNHPSRITDAMKSRLDVIEFGLSGEEAKGCTVKSISMVMRIMKAEGFKIAPEAAIYLFKRCYPDLRKIINSLDNICNGLQPGETVTIDHINSAKLDKYEELYKMLLTKPTNVVMYAYLKEHHMNKEQDTVVSLGTNFIDFLIDSGKTNIINYVGVITHRYEFELPKLTDKFRSLWACVAEIMNVMAKV